MLIHRHPHIYGDVEVNDNQDVKKNWEQLKLQKGNKSVLEGVPTSLPTLIKANRIQEKVNSVGFGWEEPWQVFEELQEDTGELQDMTLWEMDVYWEETRKL
jgi:XTP/dITP diphosphohydrolase